MNNPSARQSDIVSDGKLGGSNLYQRERVQEWKRNRERKRDKLK